MICTNGKAMRVPNAGFTINLQLVKKALLI